MKQPGKKFDLPKTHSSSSEIIENTIDLLPTTSTTICASSNVEANLNENVQKPSTSREEVPASAAMDNLRPNRGVDKGNDIQIFMTNDGGLINSTNAMHNENYLNRADKSKKQVPPSYSSVLKSAPPMRRYDSSTFALIPFVNRPPPPSYAEVHLGGWGEETASSPSLDSLSLGPEPMYVGCPHCRTIVVSTISRERSNLSWILSVILCIFMCWPCCLLPFCLKSFINTYHFCPDCHLYLGVYRPC